MKKNVFLFLKIAASGLLAAVLLVFFVPIRSNTLTHAMLSPLERKFSNEIEFTSSRIWFPGDISLTDMSVIDKRGRLYYCKTADIKYSLFDMLFKGREVVFELKEPRFYRDIGLLNSVADILSIMKMPDVEFAKIEGAMRLHGNATYIKNITASSGSMRISGSGWVDKNGSLDCEVKFLFSKGITDKVPDAARSLLLTPENEDWMGISFKAKGNYRKPSLHIISDRIELNILESIFGN